MRNNAADDQDEAEDGTPDKGGRPPFKPTLEQRQSVAISAAAGMAHEEMAIALGISRNTLEKYFEHELSVGAYQKRMAVLEAMHAAALKGNVAAAKEFMRAAVPVAVPPLDPPAKAPEGKKERANADAKTAQRGTEWETLLPGSPRAQ